MRVIMFGPHQDVMGGISAVVQTWERSRAIQEEDVRYLATMVDGSFPAKLATVLRCEGALIRDALRRGPADLYHIHVSTDASFWRKLVLFQQLLLTGRPILVHVHGAKMIPFYESSPAVAAAMRWMFSRATRVIALYREFADLVRQWTGGRARVVQMMNPVVLSELERPLGLARPRVPTVLFMGIIGDRKGAFDLLRAVPRVLERAPEARFRFGGNGEVKRLNTMATELGVSHAVEALGWLRGQDKVRAFHEATAYCLPSYHEALPVSVLEAMAAALPVVSTTVAGIPDAVREGETGFLVQPGDVDAIADRLGRLVSDPALALRMGEAGYKRAQETFDHEVIGREVVALWEEVLREHRAQ